MTRAEWIKHVAVFVAAIFLVWLAGLVPGMILGIAPLAGAPSPSPVDLLLGLLSAWPIYIGIAIVQALTFHYVPKFTTPIFLAVVFGLALILAWRYNTVAPVEMPPTVQAPAAQ